MGSNSIFAPKSYSYGELDYKSCARRNVYRTTRLRPPVTNSARYPNGIPNASQRSGVKWICPSRIVNTPDELLLWVLDRDVGSKPSL